MEEGTSQLSDQLPGNEVDLQSTHTPHLTLFLADFNAEARAPNPGLLPALERATLSHRPLSLKTSGVSAEGNYLFLNVEKTPGLQRLNDDLVEAARPFVAPNRPIPPWIQLLPEPDRTLRTSLVKRYGSPGVGPCYIPHITLGYHADPKRVSTAADALNRRLPTRGVEFEITTVSVGDAGANGTVLTNGATHGSLTLRRRPA